MVGAEEARERLYKQCSVRHQSSGQSCRTLPPALLGQAGYICGSNVSVKWYKFEQGLQFRAHSCSMRVVSEA